MQTPVAQRAEKLGPEVLALGVSAFDAEDLAVSVGGDVGGNHDRPRHHPPVDPAMQ